ncbi:NAD(P)-dependent oxidoreductase [Marinicellulosiphila megalodicopiae]|uniref:NAD(P)-dependent oxidoreductase n=1 Tax=Marinicellulosiphila megalodicopiae TaxID=2724896 RepID=UPI003BB12918
MKALVLGASGATGHKLVEQLLNQNTQVKVIVRPSSVLPQSISAHPQLEIIRGEFLSFSDHQIQTLVQDCQIIASCLGHNLTLKGMFGNPRALVTNTIKRLCEAVALNQPNSPVKLVLMSSTGVRNKLNLETVSTTHNILIHLLRWLLPPHKDNEQATAYLQNTVSKSNPFIDWVAVRPDALIVSDQVSEYKIEAKPTRDALFNAGEISRINVAHFMASLVMDSDLWTRWKYKTPVIYAKTN